MTFVDWKSIDSAPKNGAGELAGPFVLVWCDRCSAVYQARWTTAKGIKGMSWVTREGLSLHRLLPSHWAEMPAAPVRELAAA